MPAMVVKRMPLAASDLSSARRSDKPYVVIIKYDGKYSSCCMGEVDTMVTYDAVRCSNDELDGVCERAAVEKGFERIYRGLELRI